MSTDRRQRPRPGTGRRHSTACSPIDPKPARSLAAADGLLVATDFDGTLAPIAATPETPTATPANRRALSALARRCDVRVAVVSGRAIDDLGHRVGVPGVIYAGNHGLELAVDGTVTVHRGAQALRPTIARLAAFLSNRLAPIPGARVEDKGVTLTVHYRQVPAAARPAVFDALDDATARLHDDVRVVPGKASVEFRPAVAWDKGSTVRSIAARLPRTWRTVYLGDDTTDEDVFRTLGPRDVGIYVGTDATAADVRLSEQSQVAPFLAWLRRLRADSRWQHAGHV